MQLLRLELKGAQKLRKATLLAQLTMISFFAALSRALTQHIPSVEPLSAFVLASTISYGLFQGIYVACLGYWLSNFMVWGGQGPWTIFQMAGEAFFALIAYTIIKFFGPSMRAITLAMLFGTLGFELVVNLMVPPFAWIFSVPYTLTHVTSNVAFSVLVPTLTNLMLKFKGEEKEVLPLYRDWILRFFVRRRRK